mgnify:CR=1 FL=1
MSTSTVIAIISLILYLGILISIPFRISKYGKREKTDSEKNFWFREIAIFIFSLAICCLCLRMDFGLIGDIVLCGCGVLGAYIASKELVAPSDSEE